MFDKDSLYSNIGESIDLYVKKHTYFCAFLIIYCSLLGYFGSDRTFECGEFILEKMHIERNRSRSLDVYDRINFETDKKIQFIKDYPQFKPLITSVVFMNPGGTIVKTVPIDQYLAEN